MYHRLHRFYVSVSLDIYNQCHHIDLKSIHFALRNIISKSLMHRQTTPHKTVHVITLHNDIGPYTRYYTSSTVVEPPSLRKGALRILSVDSVLILHTQSTMVLAGVSSCSYTFLKADLDGEESM